MSEKPKVDEETMEWAKREAAKIAGQPRPKTRPLKEFLDDLRAKRVQEDQ